MAEHKRMHCGSPCLSWYFSFLLDLVSDKQVTLRCVEFTHFPIQPKHMNDLRVKPQTLNPQSSQLRWCARFTPKVGISRICVQAEFAGEHDNEAT